MFALLLIETTELSRVHQQTRVRILNDRVFGVRHMGVDEVVQFICKEMEDSAQVLVHFFGVLEVAVEVVDSVVHVVEVLFHWIVKVSKMLAFIVPLKLDFNA